MRIDAQLGTDLLTDEVLLKRLGREIFEALNEAEWPNTRGEGAVALRRAAAYWHELNERSRQGRLV